MTKKEITKGVTFRIPENIIKKLNTYSKRKQISVNTLANQIFKNFVEWDFLAVEAGWMVFPKPSLKELIDNTSEKELERIAKHKVEYHKDIRFLMVGTNDLTGFLILLRQKSQRSGFPFTETKSENGIIHFVIQHDLGEKWSYFNKLFYTQMINDLGYKVNIETTKNTLVLDIYSDKMS